MATKRQLEITTRLKRLIDKAGGQADFCRRVWPRESAEDNKAKVSKWYRGAGIRPAEAVRVAKAFNVRAAWLLLGELPEREGVTRTEAALAADVAAYVAHEGIAGTAATVEPWLREMLVRMIKGADLLGALVQLVREECESTAAILETRARIGFAIKTLPAIPRVDIAREELQRAYASAQFSSGRVFLWKPVTFTPRAALAAQRDLGPDAPVTKESEKKKRSPRAPKSKNKPTKRRKQ